MKFKTPALLFNVNGEHGARARRLFINRSKIQRSFINQYYPKKLLLVVGLLLSRGHAQQTHDREKSANLF
jgi:hypothetical protein